MFCHCVDKKSGNVCPLKSAISSPFSFNLFLLSSLVADFERIYFGREVHITKQLLIILLEFYQKAISPYLGPRCRFVPSCSNYTKEAVEKKGVVRGTIQGFTRIIRCHPWGGRGYDPVH